MSRVGCWFCSSAVSQSIMKQVASDLDEATQRQLARGTQIREFMKQAPGQPYSVLQQVALIYTGTRTNVNRARSVTDECSSSPSSSPTAMP